MTHRMDPLTTLSPASTTKLKLRSTSWSGRPGYANVTSRNSMRPVMVFGTIPSGESTSMAGTRSITEKMLAAAP